MNKKLDLRNPRTFNEKMQWLKLYDRKDVYTTLVDKYEVKKIIVEVIGEDYIIPTYGVWEKFDDISFNELPEQFVLKCTHDSGGLVICNEKESFDYLHAKEMIENSLNKNFFWLGREWPYKNVKPRIIAEKYMGDNIRDYKFFCFDGEPRIILVCNDRFSKDGLKEDFYDESWNHLEIKRPTHGNASYEIECPKQFEMMKKLAARIAEKIPFARVDFYELDNRVYFGEVTFYPAGGFEGFKPDEWDFKLGEWIKLPRK